MLLQGEKYRVYQRFRHIHGERSENIIFGPLLTISEVSSIFLR